MHALRYIVLPVVILALLPAKAGEWSGYGEVRAGGGIFVPAEPYDWAQQPEAVSGVAGHLHWKFSPDYAVQLDVQGEYETLATNAEFEKASRAINRTSYGAGLHMLRNAANWQIGVLASLGKDEPFSGTMFSAGFEAALQLERLTAFGQIVYSEPTGHSEPHSLFAEAGARYFWLDNLSVGAKLGGGVIDARSSYRTGPFIGVPWWPPGTTLLRADSIGGGHNGSLLRWGTSAEYRFENLPIGLSLGYRGSYATSDTLGKNYFVITNGIQAFCDSSASYGRTAHLFEIRLRYYFGSTSLIDNDHNGVALSDPNPWYGEDTIPSPELGAPRRPPSC